MRRPFITLLALFLLVAVVADANARNRRRSSSGTGYSSTPYIVTQDGTIYYSSGYYMPDSTVYIERPTFGERRVYGSDEVSVYDDTVVFGPYSTGVYRSFYYEPVPVDGNYYNTRRGRMRR
jgi:hypothetical protein